METAPCPFEKLLSMNVPQILLPSEAQGSSWPVLTRFAVRRRMGRCLLENFIELGEIEAFRRKKSMKAWVIEAIRPLPSWFMALLLGSLKGHCPLVVRNITSNLPVTAPNKRSTKHTFILLNVQDTLKQEH